MDDPIWIYPDLALAIHKRQLSEHGGADGVRDQGLLESALGRPRNLFAYTDPTPDIPALAASYAFGIARNHAFLDGNKRTAAVVCETFLELNGFELDATDAELYPVYLSLAAGDLSESQFAAWLASHTRRITPA
jgi:death on curing protein